MCVDFRDLNKACPKDDFSLPHIKVPVDSATSSVMYSFVDGFSCYNQIMMVVMDKIMNSRVCKEEVLDSFTDLNLKTIEKSPNAPRRVEDLLG